MIHNLAVVHPRAVVEDSATVGPYVVIEDYVYIGEGVTVLPHAVVGRYPKAAGIIVNQPHADRATFIGAGSVIGAGAVVYAGVHLDGDNLIGDGAKIREDTTIGKGTVVGSNCTIQNKATIGSRVRIVDLSHITFDCEIGDDSFISVGVYTMNDNSMGAGGTVIGPKIGNRVKVGGGAMFLPGVTVGDDAVVGAGAVVTKNVGAGERVMGVPATNKKRAESEAKNQLISEYFKDDWQVPDRPYTEWPPIG